jgi:hypothetical protein
LDSASNSAAGDKGHTGALYSKNSDPAAEVGMALFTTTLGLYGGVLWCGELQGFITHEMMPIAITAIAIAIIIIAKQEAEECMFLRNCLRLRAVVWDIRVERTFRGLRLRLSSQTIYRI